MTASDPRTGSTSQAPVAPTASAPPADKAPDWMYHESEGGYEHTTAPRGVLWMLLAMFIVISGLTISNGYAINHINARLDRHSENAMLLELDMNKRVREVGARIDRRLFTMATNITRLEEDYCRIAEQEGDMLLLFKRLSDHYDTISQQLREVNLDSGDL